MILSTQFAEEMQHDEVCAVLSHAGYLGGIVVMSAITEALEPRGSPKRASLLLYSILYVICTIYFQIQTDMCRCTHLKVHLLTATAHTYIHMNHTHSHLFAHPFLP